MRRIFIFIVLLAACLAASAKGPKLACESLFTEKAPTKEGIKLVVIEGEGNYYRSISVENDPALAARIKECVEKDKKLASNKVQNYTSEKTDVILNIPSGDYMINVGYTVRANGRVELWVQSDPAAFK